MAQPKSLIFLLTILVVTGPACTLASNQTAGSHIYPGPPTIPPFTGQANYQTIPSGRVAPR